MRFLFENEEIIVLCTVEIKKRNDARSIMELKKNSNFLWEVICIGESVEGWCNFDDNLLISFFMFGFVHCAKLAFTKKCF